MNREEMQEFLEPHLKKVGYSLSDVMEVRFEPFHWVIHYWVLDGAKKVAWAHNGEDWDVVTGELRIRYDGLNK